MVQIDITYEGQLRCSAVHTPSGESLTTDAPKDNEGKGESFSPTDLVATALGGCMATIMGIYARRKEIPLEGMKITVNKVMSTDAPRRIAKLETVIEVPLEEGHPDAPALERAALSCPVHQSLHPEMEKPLTFRYVGS
ncbi:OsmC family protein [Sulfuriroseicoccus oceanibius]|uniref:OsmC family protein n=1 Tax=Sulfuriroseicoccus oceanibius TaxID=2707525 RepID=A0A6B3L0X9_9BACT|nr:OsmC family protein [Sulfuriroseicoccus oceanibius]QQL44223.1 OsmC family protein [Sulfuriroseicoccus oceanibius]